MTDIGLREKIGYLVHQAASENASAREDCLDVADEILLLIMATPDADVDAAIAAAIPSADPRR